MPDIVGHKKDPFQFEEMIEKVVNQISKINRKNYQHHSLCNPLF